MIPKRIITIWLNNQDMPREIRSSIKTHKIDGYEHKLITLENCPHNKYIDECLSRHDVKGWVKASDYIRMIELYNNGGIYLDADMEVLKPFDSFLNLNLFVCREDSGFVANSIIGSIAELPVMKKYMDIIDNFNGKNNLVFEYGMELWNRTLDTYYGSWNLDSKNILHPSLDPLVSVYPSEYFLPYNHETGKIKISSNSHTVHKFNKSWK